MIKPHLPSFSRRAGISALGAVTIVGLSAGVLARSADSDRTGDQADELDTVLGTAEVVRQDLAEFSTIDGSLGLDDPLTINSSGNGTLVTLPEQGAIVERGDVFYVVSDPPTDDQLDSAAAQVETNESQLASSVSQLTDLSDGASGGDLAAAEASVASAQRALAELTEPATSADLAAAAAQVDSAQQALDDLRAGAGEADLASAEAQIAQATAASVSAEIAVASAWTALLSAHSDYCALEDPPVDVCSGTDLPLDAADVDALDSTIEAAIGDGDADGIVDATQKLVTAQNTYDNATANAASATESLAAAEASLARLTEPPAPSMVASAEAAVAGAQQAYGDLIAGSDPARIAEAEANLTAANARLADLRSGASPEAISAAEAAEESASAALDLAAGQYEALLDADMAPVLLYGHVPSTRTLELGTTGEDVAQLQANLIALGHDADGDVTVSGTFDFATASAVTAWKTDTGVTVTNTVEADDVLFLPGPVQIDSWGPGVQVGGAVMSGTAVVDVTPIASVPSDTSPDPEAPLVTTQRVTADLPLEDRALLGEGDELTFLLPDETEVAATVRHISSIPVEDTQTGETFVEVTLTPAVAVASLWIGADVEVEIVSELAEDVLTVPVSALVALVEGGYAVEIPDGDGTTRYVAVTTGMFADGFVQIEGDIGAGDLVLVPR